MNQTVRIVFNWLSVCLLPYLAQAQIFEPEGLNIPGTWNTWTNPPAAGSVFGSETQVSDGGVKLITIGDRRWQAQFRAGAGAGTVPFGSHTFLFTSGPTGNPYANKWANVNVQMNQLQSYVYGGATDNTVSLDSSFWYTVNWRDIGYATTTAIFMRTAQQPAHFVSMTQSPAGEFVVMNTPVSINATLSNAPGADEFFFIRFTTNDFQTSVLIPMEVNGNQISGVIPGIPAGNLRYYLFSTSVSSTSVIANQFDMHTIHAWNNNGLNFGYATVMSTAPVVNLGPDASICPGASITLDAGAGFNAYLWNTGATTQTITVSTPGNYTVTVTNANNESGSGSINISLAEVPVWSLGNDTTLCGASSFTLQVPFAPSPDGDQITIIYDATQGQTGLVGAEKVYFHSGYELVPFGGGIGWVGNWGQDDGIGEMTPLGNNLWTITITPQQYYGYAPGTQINGLLMVFRNADGSQTGKDNNGNDIFLNLSGSTPSSPFAGVTATRTPSPISSILWSTGATSPSITIAESGIYSATLTTVAGCETSDQINVTLVPAPDLGPNQLGCGFEINSILDAGAGYDSYLWSTGANAQSITVTSSGTYTVTVSKGSCTLSSSVSINNQTSSVPVNLGPNQAICGPGTSVYLDAGFALVSTADSLTIIYDATQGVSGLAGAQSVYFHSGYELFPFGGSQGWIGNWGQDDGVGRMTALGNNRWKITINPQAYYGLPPGTSINGLFMVFRNANGTATGKDNNDNDIFLNISTPQPVSAFAGVSAIMQRANDPLFTSVQWSNGSSATGTFVFDAGTYWLTATTADGCTTSDTITIISGSAPSVNLGPNVDICPGDPVVFDAGPGFAFYSWSTGANTQAITVTQPGTYVVVVTNEDGCEAFSVVGVTAVGVPIAIASVVNTDGLTVTFANQSSGANTSLWDFNGDGITDQTSTQLGTITHTYPAPGNYTARLIVLGNCGNDTMFIPVNISPVGVAGIFSESLRLFPNPAADVLHVQWSGTLTSAARISIYAVDGRLCWSANGAASPSEKMDISLQGLTAGLYLLHVEDQHKNLGTWRFVKQ